MPKINPIQTSFASGEISPRFLGHSEAEVYATGVREAINYYPLAQGPMAFRPGFKYIGDLEGDYGRVFTFPVTLTEIYYAIFTDAYKLQIVNEQGIPSDANLVSNGDFHDLGQHWTTFLNGPGGAIAFPTGLCYMLHGNNAGAYVSISQVISVPAGTETDLHELRIIMQVAHNIYVRLGTTLGGNDLIDGNWSLPETYATFTPGQATIYLEIRTVTKNSERYLESVSIRNLTSSSEFVSPYNQADLTFLQYDIPPGGKDMYLVTPRIQPHKISYDVVSSTWNFIPITFTSPPAVWTAENWPHTIAFFQGRSWWGGTDDQPETFWASVSGDYEDLTIGTTADDAMELTLSNRGVIRWMKGLKNMLIGTETGEYVVTAEGGTIVPGDIQADLQSSHGSKRIQAKSIGNKILYSSTDGRRLYDMGYRWTDEGWVSVAINFKSEHITLANTIRATEYLENAENIIICLTDVGTVLSCTYIEALNIIGWARHETPDGLIIDISHSELAGRSNLLILAQRDSLPGRLTLEVIPSFSPFRDTIYMDSYEEQLLSPADTILNPIPHLAGLTVGIITDGAMHPDITLSGSGGGTLQWKATNVVIGLKYLGTIRTMPFEGTGGLLKGATLGFKRRWNKIYVRVISSLKPLINGVRPPERHPSTPMDTGEPPITEDVQVTNLGYDNYGEIVITNDLPARSSIAAIFGEMSEDEV